MKFTRAVTILVLIVSVSPSFAAAFQLDGETFRPAAPLVWSPTNELLQTVPVYKLTQRQLSQSAISNAMQIGSFKPTNRMPSSEKGVLLFQDKQESMTRFLKISTKEGWVRYGDSKAEGIPIHGVPSFNEVERLAITYLYSFGCDTNQLLAKPRPRIETTTTSYKKRDGEEVGKEASRRGLILFRQIGGFQIPGEYLSIDFGNNARVCNLSLNWKNVNLLKQCDTVNSDQIMAWIKNGKATVSPDVDPRVAKAKSLAIKGVSVCHTLGNSQDLFYPYALLEVVAVLENEATLSFQLSCPILADYPAGQP